MALKLLAADLADDERFRERFLRESKLAASIEHPHIVPIYDAGEVDGSLYIAMRYVEGTDLKTLLRQEGAVEPARALALVSQLAEALEAAHERGLVHRDVKPSNALLDAGGRLYLTDFGLTKSVSDRSALTATGQIIGTVDYVAPEQIEGKPVDSRADVYSLGCLLYECLTGEVPFPRDSELAALWAHVQERPPKATLRSPELPKEIDAVIAKAMAKAPTRRFSSCADLVEAARAALPPPEPPEPPQPRRRLLFGLGALLVAATALGAALMLWRGGGGSATQPTLAVEVDSLQRIDPRTNRLVATIEPGSNPMDVAVGEGAVWVVNAGDRSVSRIDPETNTVRTAPAGGDPRAVAAGEGSIWVVSPRDAALARIDPNTLTTLSTTPLTKPGGQIAGGVAPAVVVGAGSVWAGGLNINRVAPHGFVLETIADPHLAAGIAFGEGAVWVRNATATQKGGTVWRIDPATNRVVAKIGLGFYPFGLAVGEGRVWTAHSEADALVRIDPATNRVAARIPVGDSPLDVAVGFGSVWVANFADGTVSRVDPRGGKVVATIEVGLTPEHLAVGEGGVWVIVRSR